LVAAELAEVAEFFSFGTNDLTQTAFGFSRDDIGKFLGLYEERKLVPANPFVTIDQPGVGRLMQIAAEEGRATRSGLKLGICGEHGGDPDSVRFCHTLGLDYVSCSPFRVPTARLAAGQAASARPPPPPSELRAALMTRRPELRAPLAHVASFGAGLGVD